jgi:hypothetical protein
MPLGFPSPLGTTGIDSGIGRGLGDVFTDAVSPGLQAEASPEADLQQVGTQRGEIGFVRLSGYGSDGQPQYQIWTSDGDGTFSPTKTVGGNDRLDAALAGMDPDARARLMARSNHDAQKSGSGGSFELGADGKTSYSGKNGKTYSAGSPTGSTSATPSTPGPTPTVSTGGGTPRATGGNARGGVSNPFSPGGIPVPGGGIPPIGGAPAGSGQTGFEIGPIDDPGARPTGGGFTARPSSLFDFLPANFNQMTPEQRQAALASAVTRAQEQSRDASLEGFDAAAGERAQRTQGTRALEDKILGDTDVFSEAEIQRNVGATTQAANKKANVLGQALAERRAAAGSARSGSAQSEQQQVLQGALNTAVNAESDLRARAREANFQSRNQALGAAGQSIGRDIGQGQDLAANRAGTIGSFQTLGDAFVSQNLLNSGGQGYNVNTNPGSGFRVGGPAGGVTRERLF